MFSRKKTCSVFFIHLKQGHRRDQEDIERDRLQGVIQRAHDSRDNLELRRQYAKRASDQHADKNGGTAQIDRIQRVLPVAGQGDGQHHGGRHKRELPVDHPP